MNSRVVGFKNNLLAECRWHRSNFPNLVFKKKKGLKSPGGSTKRVQINQGKKGPTSNTQCWHSVRQGLEVSPGVRKVVE